MKCPKCHNDVSNDSLYCSYCGMNLLYPEDDSSQTGITKNITSSNDSIFNPGDLFANRYKIIEELGRGGMGRVYKAEDRVLGTCVALKVIRPEYISNSMMIKRFKKEILLAREITHENVVRIFDFGESDNIKFISMEYIDGVNLKDLINDEKPIEIERIIDITKKICSGLEAAHKKGIIHRDLKPQNIMIDKNEHVYITDFGLAKSTNGESISQSGIIIGTPQYIAPEQWKGENVNSQTDIYTLGIIMYEMLTKHSLFESDSDIGYLQKHLNEKPVFNKNELKNIPVFLRKVVLKCLEKEIKFRYINCSEIITELEDRNFKKDNLFQSIRKFNFNWWNLSPLIIVTLLILSAVIFRIELTKSRSEISKQRSVAIVYFNNLTGQKRFDYLKYSLSDLLITDLAQSKFVRVLPENKLFNILKSSNSIDLTGLNQEMLSKVRNRGNVNYIITGSFNRSGDFLRISTRLIDLETGDLIDSNSVDTKSENIFSAVDRLTKKIKKGFKLTDNEIFEDIDPDIKNITTSSQEAFKFYVKGKRLFHLGNYKGSIFTLKKAIKKDPEFAMGYRLIAWAYAFVGDLENRKKYFNKTLEHSDKLSERERLLIYADYFGEKEITQLKAIEYYKKILKIYPDDVNANYMLGITYRDLENWDDAIQNQTMVLKIDRTNIKALNELFLLNCAKFKYDKALNILKSFELKNPNVRRKNLLEMKLRLYLIQGKFELASLTIDKLNFLTKAENSKKKYLKGKIYLLKNQWKKFEREYSYQLKNFNGFNNRIDLLDPFYINLLKGKFKSISGVFNKLKNNDKNHLMNIFSYSEILNIFYRNGAKDDFNRLFKQIKNVNNKDFPYYNVEYLYLLSLEALLNNNLNKIESRIKDFSNKKSQSIYSNDFNWKNVFLLGEYYLKKGEYKNSEKYFLKAKNFLQGVYDDAFHPNSSAIQYFSLGKLYYKWNKFAESEKWFNKIISMNIGRYVYGDLYAMSLYYLGKIYKFRGWKGKAIDSFFRFNFLWKNTDKAFSKNLINNQRNQLLLLNRSVN